MKPEDFQYFDIHSHLNFPEFDADREVIIAAMAAQHIGTITVGTNLVTSREAIVLAQKYPHLFASVGLHPLDISEVGKDALAALEIVASEEKVMAIGECGLDYSRLKNPGREKELQKQVFEGQIDLAVRFGKSVVIHCRDAYPDTLEILSAKKRQYGERLRGDFHFFTSRIAVAKQCLDLDFSISFTGPITYGTQYDEVVRYVPLEKMMAETDSPFAAPVPYRGKRNQPLYVEEVVAKIATIKGQSLDSVSKILCNNVFELFFNKP